MFSTIIFLTAITSLAINPLSNNIDFSSFDRVFGNATLAGINADARISNFIRFHLLLIPLLLVLFTFVSTWIMQSVKRAMLSEEAFSLLDDISVCGIALSIVFIFTKYSRAEEANCYENYGIQIAVIIVCVILLYIKIPFMGFERFRFGLFLGISIALLVAFLLQNSEKNGFDSPSFWSNIFLVSIGIASFLLLISKQIDTKRFQFAFMPLAYGLLAVGLSLEIFNILNQHGIYIVNRLFAAKIIFLITLSLSILLLIISGKEPFFKISSYSHWETIYLIGLLASLAYFTCIPPLKISATTELFEQANAGMLVNDALVWGKIPMLNSFDAHTLCHSLGMLVYGILNNDFIGASYFGYGFIWIIPTIIFSFLVYKEAFNKYFAFFLVLLVPRVSCLSVSMGIIAIAALHYVMKRQTFRSYIYLFVSVTIALVYQIPQGFAYGGAAILIIVVMIITDSLKRRTITVQLKEFARAFLLFVSIMMCLWVALCIQQGVNPIRRALEFLSIAQSTNNWTYASLGDTSSTSFALLYSILPILAVACLVWLITHFRRNALYCTACAFIVTYIFNLTRALQRHSLAENQIDHIIFTSILGIALVASIVLPKFKRSAFLITGILIATPIFNVGSLQTTEIMANTAITSINSCVNYYNGSEEKTIRVDMSAPYNAHAGVISMINKIIPEGETFCDLSGDSILYALTGREKPVYANQSVTELSGEYSQKCFIDEIENFHSVCDFVLMRDVGIGYELDGVRATYRYYHVYEYVYENYRPLCEAMDGYALWVRKNRYEEIIHNEKIFEYTLAGNVVFENVIYHSNLTDDNWTNGILNSAPNHMLFPAREASVLVNAATIYSSIDHANVIDAHTEGEWVRLTIDKDAGAFESGIIAADLYETKVTPIGYDYGGTTHTMDIGQIAYVWGQYDNKKAWENEIVEESALPDAGISDTLQEKAKYAVILLDAATDGYATLSFQNQRGEDIVIFNFTLLKGCHRYIIRVSTDWWWNNNVITSYSVNTNTDSILRSIRFVVGD